MNLPHSSDMSASPFVLGVLVGQSANRDWKWIVDLLLQYAQFHAMVPQRRLQGLARRAILGIDWGFDYSAWGVLVGSRGDLNVDVAIAAVSPGKLHVGTRDNDELKLAPFARR